MSARSIRCRNKFRPVGVLRDSGREDLCRVRVSCVGTAVAVGLGLGRSMRRTVAP